MKQSIAIILLLALSITLAKISLDLKTKVDRYEHSFKGDVKLNDYSGDYDCSESGECDF